MKAIVLANIVAFMERYEGRVYTMYLDVKGLVTIGIGNLIDPLPAGVAMVHRDTGLPTTPDEVRAEWARVKLAKALIPLGWRAFERLCTLKLTEEQMSDMVQHRVLLNEAYLARRWPAWESLPAAAQLALHSDAWAAGPGWAAPRLDAAVKRGDWLACGGNPGDPNVDLSCRGESWLNDSGNPGLRKRNLANKALWDWARTGDPETLPAT